MNNIRHPGNFLGAFADGAVLFPLLVILSQKGGFSGMVLLASAGLAYIVSGYFFRIPISVQPLKSIAIASVAVGASFNEVRISCAMLGFVCIILSLFNKAQWLSRVPQEVIHSMQAALGALFIYQGLLKNLDPLFVILVIGLSFAVIYFSKTISFLGLGSIAGLFIGLIMGSLQGVYPELGSGSPDFQLIRVSTILSLVVPQIALTLSNSVLGTYDVSKRYFGSMAKKVTYRNLLLSIGLGNLVVSLFGGLPYCHGSGGVTAHYRAGSRHWISNVTMGCFLLVLSCLQVVVGIRMIQYPLLLMSCLLVVTGIYHLHLAKPTWKKGEPGKILIFSSLAVTFTTGSLLWALVISLILTFLFQRWVPSFTQKTLGESI